MVNRVRSASLPGFDPGIRPGQRKRVSFCKPSHPRGHRRPAGAVPMRSAAASRAATPACAPFSCLLHLQRISSKNSRSGSSRRLRRRRSCPSVSRAAVRPAETRPTTMIADKCGEDNGDNVLAPAPFRRRAPHARSPPGNNRSCPFCDLGDHDNSASRTAASFRSAVSNPSVNQPQSGASSSRASSRRPCSPHSRARSVAARSS